MRRLISPSIWCVLILTANVPNLQAQSVGADVINREYAIKAAYLYNFGYYVQWPADSFASEQTPFVIGILGGNPFGDVLEEIARTKTIDGRPIVFKRFATMADYQPCQILFVTSSASAADMLAAIEKAKSFPLLLVGESPGFTEQGGVINFFIEENKVRFEVNMEVAKREQLKISSKLLSLAKIVK